MTIVPQGNPPIKIIGLDCDDPDALEKFIINDQSVLKKADIICGAAPILQKLRHEPDLRGRLLKLSTPFEQLFDSLFNLSRQGLKVLVLADGDPLFFGIGSSLVKRAPKDSIEITPAISTLQAACARQKIPWHNVYCISLHGTNDLAPLYDAVASGHVICILTGGSSQPDTLAGLLLDRGVDWFEAHIFERMGSPDEVAITMSLKNCAKSHFGHSPTLLLVPGQKPRAPSLGLEESRFCGAYPYPRPVRGAILEMLKIGASNTVWDIGANSGILSLESCVLAHEGRVIAIEKNMDLCLDIQRNRRLLGAVNLDIKAGEAPEILADLPVPDRIFIGTPPEESEMIFKICVSALPRSGRLVISCKQLSYFHTCEHFLKNLGWPLESIQIQASSNIPENMEPAESPANSVFLLAAQKP